MGQTSKPLDIKKTGRLGYRQLWEQNRPDYDKLVEDGEKELAENLAMLQTLSSSEGSGYDPENLVEGEGVESPLAHNIGKVGSHALGTSMFDKGFYNAAEFESAGDIRAENQPGIAKIGAGLAKAVVLAGTTYCQLPAMLLGACTGLITGDNIWDNQWTRALKAVNDLSEEYLPNYYTQVEQETPWWRKIGTANFIGDTFIKNLGFCVGALLSGGLVSKAVQYSGLPQLAGRVATAIGSANAGAAPGVMTSFVSAGMMALGEAGVEAINNSTEWADAERERVDAQFYADLGGLMQKYDPNSQEYAEARAELWKRYNDTLLLIADDAKRMGNADLIMNLPILMISDLVQFGGYLSGGYKTNRIAGNIIKTAEEATATAGKSGQKDVVESVKGLFRKGAKTEAKAVGEGVEKAVYSTTRNWKGSLWAGTRNMLSEGNEELAQRIAQEIAGRRYEYDLGRFYAAQNDIDAQDRFDDWASAFQEGLIETISDPSAWEEWFVGSVTGALGVPTFRSVRSESGKFRSPVTLQGGFFGAVKEYNAETKRQQALVERLNSFMADPKRANYYRGIVRHYALDEAMRNAAEDEDVLEYKNNEFAQMLSDVMMFDNAGRIDDLIEYINMVTGTDDANLKALVEATTDKVKGRDGKTYYVGPYVTKDGTPMYSASEDGRAKMVESVKKNREGIFKVINRYRGVKNEIDVMSGEVLSDDQLEQLAYLRMAAMDYFDRAVAMAGETRPYVQEARDWVQGLVDALEEETAVLERDGKLDEKQRKARKATVDAYHANREMLDMLLNTKSDKKFIEALGSLPGFADLVQLLTAYSIAYNSASDDEAISKHNEMIEKMRDICILTKMGAKFNESFNAFIDNPGQMKDEMEKTIREQREKRVAKNAEQVRERLDAAKDDIHFFNLMDDVQDGPVKERLERDLKEAGSERYARWKERNKYAQAVRKRIVSSKKYSKEAKSFAERLLDEMLSTSSDILKISNPGSYRIGAKDISVAQSSYGLSLLRDSIRSVNDEEWFRTKYGVVRNSDPKRKARPDKVRKEGAAVGSDEVQSVDPAVPERPAAPDTSPTPEVSDGEIVAQNEAASMPDVAGKTEGASLLDEDEASVAHAQDDAGAAAATSAGDMHTGEKSEWVRAIPQVKEGTSERFDDAMDREGKDFHKIYDYLESNGAFAYVNSGKLKYGDRIGFMIDPEFPNTIFIITGNGQIIGSMFESDSKLREYAGMREFVEAVHAEYESRPENKTGVFVSRYTSEVTAVFDGTVPIETDPETALRDLAGLMEWRDGKAYMPDGSRPLLAVYGVGGFKALPEGVNSQQIKLSGVLVPGTVMILIPTASGKYAPMVLGVRKFSADDLHFGSVKMENNPVLNSLEKAIGSIVDAARADDADAVKSAVLGLKEILSEVKVIPRSDDEERRKLYIDYNSDHRSIKVSFRRIDRNGNDMHRTDESGNVMRDSDKNELADEQTFFVNLTSRNADLGGQIGNVVSEIVEDRDRLEVVDQLSDVLMNLGLTFRVDFTRVNDSSGYNDMLMRSGVLKTSMQRAECVGSYYHIAAVSPDGTAHGAGDSTVVVGKEGLNALGGPEGAQGTVSVTFHDVEYDVDVGKRVIYRNGKVVKQRTSETNSLIIDLAWARNAYGDTWNSSQVYYGMCITPGGKVLDMRRGVYVGGEQASKARKAIKGHKGSKSSDEVIGRIAEAQKRVDKEMTDGSYYYVMEEDGRKHRYSRVGGEVAGNTEEEENIRVAVQDVAGALMNAKGISEWNTVLAEISEEYGYDFKTEFGSQEIDRETALAVAGRLRDVLESGRKGAGTRRSGREVSELVRSFFTARESDGYPSRPDGMSDRAYNALMDRLVGIRENMLRLGERFHSEGLVVFHRYADGRRVAGTIDILAVDRDGNFKIYDIRSSELSAHTVLDRGGREVNYFTERADGPVFRQNRSPYEQKRLEMSALKNLFESEYGVPVTTMAMIPVRVKRNGTKVVNQETGEEFLENTYIEGLEVERGIGIEYMEDCGVPREGAVERPKESESHSTAAEQLDEIEGSERRYEEVRRKQQSGKAQTEDMRTQTAQEGAEREGMTSNPVRSEDMSYGTDPARTIFNPTCETMCTADLTKGLYDGIDPGEIVTNGFRYGYFVDGDGEVKRALVHEVDAVRGIWLAAVNEGSETEGSPKRIAILTLNCNGKILSQYETSEGHWKEIAADEKRLSKELKDVVIGFDTEVEDGELDAGVLGERTVLNTLDSAPKAETSMSDVEGGAEPDLLEAQEPGEGDYEIGESDIELDDTVEINDSTPGDGTPESQSPQPSGRAGEAAIEIEAQLDGLAAGLKITSQTRFDDLTSVYKDALRAGGVDAAAFDAAPLRLKRKMLNC